MFVLLILVECFYLLLTRNKKSREKDLIIILEIKSLLGSILTRTAYILEELDTNSDLNSHFSGIDCCQIIILSIYVPSTQLIHMSYVYPYIFLIRKGNTTTIEAPFI